MSFDPLWLCREIWRDATPLCRWTVAIPFIVIAHGAAVLIIAAVPFAWLLIWLDKRTKRYHPRFWKDQP